MIMNYYYLLGLLLPFNSLLGMQQITHTLKRASCILTALKNKQSLRSVHFINKNTQSVFVYDFDFIDGKQAFKEPVLIAAGQQYKEDNISAFKAVTSFSKQKYCFKKVNNNSMIICDIDKMQEINSTDHQGVRKIPQGNKTVGYYRTLEINYTPRVYALFDDKQHWLGNFKEARMNTFDHNPGQYKKLDIIKGHEMWHYVFYPANTMSNAQPIKKLLHAWRPDLKNKTIRFEYTE